MFQTLTTSTRAHCTSLSILICASLIAGAQAEEFTPDQAKADLERLYSGLKSAEADLFAATPKAVFDRHYEELKAGYKSPVSEADLFSDFQKFAALANHGHTRLEGLSPAWPDYMARDGKLFPLSLSVSHGEVIVASAPADSGIQPGDRILSIDSKANPVWLKEITQFISAETPALAYSLMGQGDFYYFWLAYGERAQYQVTVDRDGAELEVILAALPLDALEENITLEPGFELPGRESRQIADGIGYLRPGPFFDYEAGASGDPYNAEALAAYQAFVDAAFSSFLESDTDHVILDLRDNPGGDSSFSDPVIAWFATEPFQFASEFRIRVSDETTASNQARLDLRDSAAGGVSQKFANLFTSAENGDLVLFDIPETAPREGARFEGDIHVLINRYSYSNAVTVAAMIQDYDFGTIYGEETRDMATTYGAMEHFSLPYSNFKVGYPKAHIIRPNGETISHPVTPDVSITLPPLRGTEDVMLRDVVQKIQHAE
ncbi:MAG: hypothetical protein HRT80_14495 [Henriciella sp.]|nr:hypothetical protein [Henriciella sp.]